jgi:hypothetical protein
MVKIRLVIFSILSTILLCVLAVGVYYLPPVHERLSWRVANIQSQIRYALDPPDQVVFVPQQQGQIMEEHSPAGISPTGSPTPTISPSPTATQPGPTATPQPTATPEPTSTPTATHTPIPVQVNLSGIRHEYQTFNNCGPATLSMGLSFWGWQGDQRDTKAVLRPHEDDYNVMPEEMAGFVRAETGLVALLRAGGDVGTLKRFIAAGFPVIIEKGLQPQGDWWMGHYALVSGYNDERGVFITQDSYVMANLPVPYADIGDHWWRDFNYVYIVIYPPEREAEVLELLGPDRDEEENMRRALAKAEAETAQLSGRDLFFAWYNKGTSLVGLQDYAGAAAAYDQAFALYSQIPDRDRPWRLLWYQVGPYPAYYHSGRYQDVIDLANTTLGRLNRGGLEESYYWRGMAKAALGDEEGARADLMEAIRFNHSFEPAQDALLQLGTAAP